MTKLCAFAALCAAGLAVSAEASPLTDWNLVVFGNLDSTTEVEGRTLVGGTLSGSASNYGIRLTPASSYLNTDVLVVGGNLTAGNVQMQAGNLRLGGSRSGNVNFNGGGHQINDAAASIIASSARTDLLATSAYLHGLAATNSVALPSGQPSGVTFNAIPGSGGVAVFNVSGAALLSSSLVQQIDLQMGSATSIIINVSGTTVNYNGGNMVGGFNATVASHVLWNFYEATSVNIDRQLFGAVLAPLAHLTNSTTIVGTTVADSFTQRGEVHIPNYSGFVPSAGTSGLLVMGMVAGSRRRR